MFGFRLFIRNIQEKIIQHNYLEYITCDQAFKEAQVWNLKFYTKQK